MSQPGTFQRSGRSKRTQLAASPFLSQIRPIHAGTGFPASLAANPRESACAPGFKPSEELLSFRFHVHFAASFMT
jgi:hypothetical protein